MQFENVGFEVLHFLTLSVYGADLEGTWFVGIHLELCGINFGIECRTLSTKSALVLPTVLLLSALLTQVFPLS